MGLQCRRHQACREGDIVRDGPGLEHRPLETGRSTPLYQVLGDKDFWRRDITGDSRPDGWLLSTAGCRQRCPCVVRQLYRSADRAAGGPVARPVGTGSRSGRQDSIATEGQLFRTCQLPRPRCGHDQRVSVAGPPQHGPGDGRRQPRSDGRRQPCEADVQRTERLDASLQRGDWQRQMGGVLQLAAIPLVPLREDRTARGHAGTDSTGGEGSESPFPPRRRGSVGRGRPDRERPRC